MEFISFPCRYCIIKTVPRFTDILQLFQVCVCCIFLSPRCFGSVYFWAQFCRHHFDWCTSLLVTYSYNVMLFFCCNHNVMLFICLKSWKFNGNYSYTLFINYNIIITLVSFCQHGIMTFFRVIDVNHIEGASQTMSCLQPLSCKDDPHATVAIWRMRTSNIGPLYLIDTWVMLNMMIALA